MRAALVCSLMVLGTALWPAPAAAEPAASAARSGVPDGRAVVATAQTFLGVPYVWGGQGKRGFDCSGLVEHVFAKHGYVLPRVSRQQALVGLAALPPFVAGDLLFFSESPGSHRITHVAMSLGGTRFIHAALGKGQVTYDHLGERYYAQRLVSARRPLALPPGRYATATGLAPAHAAFDAPEQAAAAASAAQAHPNQAAAGTTAESRPTADMVVEHPGEDASPLMRADPREAPFASLDDPFSERLLLPQETGFGLRLGSLGEPGRGAMLAAVDARFFGHGSGVRADVAVPLSLTVKRGGEQVVGNAGSVRSVRQWARLLRVLQVGQPDARLFARIGRTEAMTLGHGTLVRHYLPNAQSFGLSDALLQANAATLLARASGVRFGIELGIDDVFNPGVTALSARMRPEPRGALQVQVDWASDWQAPWRDSDAFGVTLSCRPMQAVAITPSTRLLQAHGLRLEAYGSLASLIAPVRPSSVAFGGHLGLLATFAREGSNALGPVFTLRLEGRLHSARYRPSYFGFAYGARRDAMPFVDASTGLSAQLPAANLLALQRGQPPEASGLIELTAVIWSRLRAGVSFEDGGALSARDLTPAFVPRSLTAFVGLAGVPMSRSGTRLLHLHVLWHTSERSRLWPPVSRALPGTLLSAVARADVFDWLDVGGAIKKPLGPRASNPGFALVVDASVHFAF